MYSNYKIFRQFEINLLTNNTNNILLFLNFNTKNNQLR